MARVAPPELATKPLAVEQVGPGQLGPQGQTSRDNPSPYDAMIFSRSLSTIGVEAYRGLVDDETITCAAGVFEFGVEPDVKFRLLNGLDDIGITLENAAAIDGFEQAGGAARGPVTTAL